MSITTRRPSARALDAGASIGARHARAAAVLRFRGLNAEALRATRRAHIEALVATIRTVLDDLRAARDERSAPSDEGLEDAFRIANGRQDRDGPDGAAREQRRLVEAVLEAALARVRQGMEITGAKRDAPQTKDAGSGEKETGHGTAS